MSNAIAAISSALSYDAVETAIMTSLSLAMAVAAQQIEMAQQAEACPISEAATELMTVAPRKSR